MTIQTIIGACILGTVIYGIITLNVLDYRRRRDGDWYPHGRKMRRFIGGQWQFRDMTDEEEFQDYDSRQW